MMVKIPRLLRKLFSQFTWEIDTPEKNIYLTFDDGPEPGVTPQVLSLLNQYDAKATFFCLGSNIENYPEIANKLLESGNLIANHGYYHFDGITKSTNAYTENIRKGMQASGSKLFRPPYGRITPWQYTKVKKDVKIIMWSIMSMDFSKNTSVEKCINNVIKNIYPGAIVVFHDNYKASATLLKALPVILDSLCKKGYTFKTLC